MKHFIVYNPATGAVLRAGTCQDQDFAAQALPGEAVMEATSDAVIVAEVNLDPVRASLCAKVDAEAEDQRMRYITPGSGQALTYAAKQAEAAALQADPQASAPFLTAEAEALGMSVADLAAEVRTQAAAWQDKGAKIEAARRKAKAAIAAATNVSEIHTASQIDWEAAAQ